MTLLPSHPSPTHRAIMRLTLRPLVRRMEQNKTLRPYSDISPTLDRVLSKAKRAKLRAYDLNEIEPKKLADLNDFIETNIDNDSLGSLPPQVLSDISNEKKNDVVQALKANHTGILTPFSVDSDTENADHLIHMHSPTPFIPVRRYQKLADLHNDVVRKETATDEEEKGQCSNQIDKNQRRSFRKKYENNFEYKSPIQ